MIHAGRYTPHIVLGPIDQREVISDPQKRSLEDYLGVYFTGGPEIIEIGTPVEVELTLVYSPEVNYGGVSKGATFTIREGGTIVGFGRVR